jgi:AmmeMemoRadiSam system protein B/AmmeMemoRadiSam system protein A
MTTTAHPTPRVRRAAVAGTFYPAAPARLAASVDGYLRDVPRGRPDAAPPRALVAPHAGFVYSGPVAATAYARLLPWRDSFDRVVILAPAHRVAVTGLALSSADSFSTPFGEVPTDGPTRAELLTHPGVAVHDGAHRDEHAVEVHLPFLQRVLAPGWVLTAVLVGAGPAATAAAALRGIWGAPRTLVVVSTDLSHFHDIATARRLDAATAATIVALDAEHLTGDRACGAAPLRAALLLAREHGDDVVALDVRTSGDTAGPADRVVGYGSFVVRSNPRAANPAAAELATGELATGELATGELDALVRIARTAIAHGVAGERWRPALGATGIPAALGRPGGAFVSLHRGGQLRGCIGRTTSDAPLAITVAEMARAAASADPRFPPVGPDELDALEVSVSVLTTPVPLDATSFDEVRRAVRPGVDGVVVERGHHRATLLPVVWDRVDDVEQFLDALWRKAGLVPGSWTPDTRVLVYAAQEGREH